MAVNRARDCSIEFHQGVVDHTYIQIAPDRGGVVEHPPIDRLTWPTYKHAEQHIEDPTVELNPYHVAEIHTRGTYTNGRWY
jgi:hypothetical protein